MPRGLLQLLAIQDSLMRCVAGGLSAINLARLLALHVLMEVGPAPPSGFAVYAVWAGLPLRSMFGTGAVCLCDPDDLSQSDR